MEASDTIQPADPAAVPEQAGSAVVVSAGIFEPGSVVECVHVASDAVLRSEGGEVVGRRVSDEDEHVGFDGLIDGEHYFLTGYSRGRFEQRRAVARSPEQAASQIQQPVQESPQTLGTGQTPPEDCQSAEVPAAAPPADAPPVGSPEGTPDAPLEEGLPQGVESPVAAPEDSTAPLGTDPAAAPVAEGTDAPAQTETEQTGGALGSVKLEPTVETSGGLTMTPVDSAEPPATPSEPVEPPAEPGTPTVDTPSAAPDAPPAEPPTDTVAAVEATVDVHDQLVAQAQQLAVPGADTLADDALRQAISEKNVTPVA